MLESGGGVGVAIPLVVALLAKRHSNSKLLVSAIRGSFIQLVKAILDLIVDLFPLNICSQRQSKKPTAG